LRFNPPSRFVPETSVLRFSAQDNSHGIFFPFNAYRQRESTSAPFDRFGLPTRPEDRISVRQRVPPRQLRRRSQAFSTSQRLAPLDAALPFSDRWRSWGSPFRDLILPRSLQRFITAGLPSCRCSRRLRNPKVLGLGFLWARDPLPRMGRHHAYYRLQGLRPRASQPSFQATLNMSCHLDLPLLGFHLLMVFTLHSVQNLRSTTATLQKLLVCCQIESFLRSAA
jgi:hypothetical protein